MTGLLVFRERLKELYSRHEVFVLPLVKFLFALAALSAVNSALGYMSKLDNVAIVLIVALMCSFLPTSMIAVFAALFSLLHMYGLCLEAALVGLIVYMLLFLLFIRFSPGESVVALLTAMLCIFKIPYVMPVAMGLVGTPASAVSVGCGVVAYYLIAAVSGNAVTIGTMGDAELAAKVRLLVDGLLGNKAMLVMIVAFVITVIVVYLIRRMAIDYSWTIAIVAGVVVDILILLVGDLFYDTNVSVLNAILGALVTVAVAKVIEFFRFCVDYSRTERVQFEDDEYYYYVKAVPKMTMAAPTKTVKKINTASRGSGTGTKAGGGSRSAAAGTKLRGAQNTVGGRSRTASAGTAIPHGGRRERSYADSAKPTSGGIDYEMLDDYEELL